MAKAAKPDYGHAPPVVKVSPSTANRRSKQRKRMMKKGRWGNQVENMTTERWNKVISAIGNGATRQAAATAAKISPQTIDAYLISNVAAYKQIRDAVLLANRRDWPTDLIEHIFDDLAMGSTLKGAAEKYVPGLTHNKLAALYRIVRKDKAIREAYDEARELQAESFLDEIIDIADDSGSDRLENGRINHEVVNRSKIKIDTRKFAMGAMVKKRFGEHKHHEHEGSVTVNHIALLTGARKRLEQTKPKPVTATIDNETGEIDERD